MSVWVIINKLVITRSPCFFKGGGSSTPDETVRICCNPSSKSILNSNKQNDTPWVLLLEINRHINGRIVPYQFANYPINHNKLSIVLCFLFSLCIIKNSFNSVLLLDQDCTSIDNIDYMTSPYPKGIGSVIQLYTWFQFRRAELLSRRILTTP